MEKLDLKKKWEHLYQPSASEIVIVDVPSLTYLMVDGESDPNTSTAFTHAVEALYSLSYTLKFSLKKGEQPVDYCVMPLEGLWWTNDPGAFHRKDKSTWKWTAMILQPDFIDSKQVSAALYEVRRKKNPAALERLRLETLHEGPSAQILYVGPFADEGPTIQRMHDFIHTAGKELNGKHHEIYLSDPRRTAPEKLKTIIRQPMREI
jgi:hypothetical protein